MRRYPWNVVGWRFLERYVVVLRFMLFAALLTLAAIPVKADADDASFSCKKARTQVERRVCLSPYVTLKKTDRDLAKWYKQALSISRDVESLRADQRVWLQSLESCVTTKEIKPHDLVCDHVHNADEKAQCFRDFCLFDKYFERTRFLHSLTTQGVTGKYVLSDRWPSGIHENFNFMDAEDKKLCKSVEEALAALGPLARPLTEQKPISESLAQTRVSWLPIAKHELLLYARKLERLLRQRFQHNIDVVETDEFTRLLAGRIASGELTISLAATPAFLSALPKAENKVISVLRYQRWADVTKTTNLDLYQQVEWFRIDNGDLSSVQPIGSTTDAFVFDGGLYFDLVSERGHDDKWQPLPNPQPELFIYKVQWYDSANTQLRTACHLLYEQTTNK